MKKIYLAAAAFLLSLTNYAQQGSVSGVLTDLDTKKPLYLSTVTVYNAADTSVITYRLSDKDGLFKVPGLPLNKPLRAVVSFSGYDVVRKDFTLTEQNSHLQLDSILMQPNSKSLDEILVIAERPPMTVRKDTIEFNAAAFKTLPNALVEDLLKKLPGVQVDRQGNISVSGKRVNRIMVDGKAFFGDDPKMATRNLPSNVIDKIQVTDDKEEMLRSGDDNINNVGKVINLTFKKGVKKGVFGKAYAGGGTNGRFEAGAIANTFRDTLQLSVLGYSNNLNRPGFSISELLQTGGIQRNSDVNNSRSVSINNSPGGGSGIKINDINFGGLTDYGGISTSSGVGLNLNHSPNSKKSLFGQYFFGNVKVDVQKDGYTEYNNADSILRRNEIQNQDVVINAHNMGIGLKLKPDSVTNFVTGINFMTGNTADQNNTAINSLHTHYGAMSTGQVDLHKQNKSKNYSHFINFTRLSKTKKGRRYNLNHNLNWWQRDNEALTQSTISYKYPQVQDSNFHRLRNELIPTLTAIVSGNISEPIAKNLSARMDARYAYEHLKNDITTFDIQNGIPVKNPGLSNAFTRSNHTASTSLGIEYRLKKLTLTPRLRYQWQQIENKLASMNSSINQKLNTLLPELSIVYGKLNINYQKQITLPHYSYLIPVWDNTNPYVINNGNPYLVPAISHSVQVNMNTYDPKLSLNVWGWARAATSKNDVIQNVMQQSNGMQIIEHINAGRSKTISGNAGVNKENKFSQKFTLTSNIGFYYEYRENYFSYNNQSSKQFNNRLYIWGGFGLNWNDVFEVNNSFNFGHQDVKHTNTAIFKSFKTTDYEITSEQIIRWPKHVIFENNISYVNGNQFVAPSIREFIRWNMAINFTMLKSEAMVLRLAVNDLLRKNNSASVNMSQNMFSYNKENTLANYYMATLTYNLRPNGVRKKVGGQSLFLF